MASLMRNGAAFYLDKADLGIKALQVDGEILPLVINAGTDRSSRIWSPYAHYFLARLEGLGKRQSQIPRALLNTLTLPLGAALRASSVDKVVFVNHWLFSKSPSPALSSAQIHAITRRLVEEYPDSFIIFRSIIPAISASAYGALVENRYRLIRSRRVYLLDGKGERHLRHSNTRSDLKCLRDSPYQIVDSHAALEMHAPRMAELYRSLNVEKHSRVNPRYNAEFFRLTLRENTLTYRAMSKDGRIDAFVGCLIQDDAMTAAVIGYDLTVPQRVGLYRTAVAIVISEATELKLQLNLGGGAGEFKILRGAVPVAELDAVYDRHLPQHRRFAWMALTIGRHFYRHR